MPLSGPSKPRELALIRARFGRPISQFVIKGACLRRWWIKEKVTVLLTLLEPHTEQQDIELCGHRINQPYEAPGQGSSLPLRLAYHQLAHNQHLAPS